MAEPTTKLLCKSCGSSLIKHVTIPSSPTPHLYRTLQAPTASETARIRETLLPVKSCLPQLDDEIEQVRAVLNELIKRRETLRKYIKEHDAYIAPIRQLPLEILTDIFSLCVPKFQTLHGRCDEAPLLLARVCAGWRKAVLSTQNLWSTIIVTHQWHLHELLAKVWLPRTISSPLSIILDAEDNDLLAVKRMWPGIAQLLRYCDRWKHLEIRLPPSMIQRLHHIRHRLPWLESLRIRTQQSSYRWPLELDIFEYAPRLRSLYLDDGIPHNVIKVPWDQLTELHARFESINECLDTLKLSPNLVRCAIYCKSLNVDAVRLYTPVLHFPHLLFLYVSVDQPDQVFSHVQFPILYDIHVECPALIGDQMWLARQPFLSLLSHSSHTLRNLTVDCLSYPENSAQIARCLRSIPSLIQLSLHGSEGWLTAELLLPLTRQGPSTVTGPYLVPELEVLELSDDTIVDTHIFADMIESRWRVVGNGPGVAHLRSIRLKLCDTEDIFDAETLERLRKFQRGMELQVISISGKDLLRHPDQTSTVA